MAFEADRVVVELIADTSKFDQPLSRSSATFEQSMDRIQSGSTRAEQAVVKGSGSRVQAIQRESAQISQFSKLLGTQLNDVGALITGPRSPFVVPVKEAPKVSNALRLVQVGGAAMAGVLGGVAVTAAFALTEAFIKLITTGNDHEDQVKSLVEKLKEHAERTRLSAEADDIWSRSLDGLIERQHRLNEELGKRLQVQEAVERQSLDQARNDFAILSQQLKDAEAERDRLRERLARAPKAGVGIGQGAQQVGVDAANLARQVQEAEKKVRDLQDAVNAAGSRITRGQILIGEEQGRAMADLKAKADLWLKLQTNITRGMQQENPTLLFANGAEKMSAALNRLKSAMDAAAGQGVGFDRTIGKSDDLNRQLRLGQITVTTYATEIRKLATELQKQADAAKEAAKANKEVAQSGRQINLAQAKAIVEGIGGTVTSGFRTIKHNEDVGGVPNSFHTKGQALDIAKTAGLTLTKIVRAFEKEGVRLIEKLDEGDHFHIAFAKRSGPRGPSAETLAKRAAAAAEREANRQQAFDNEKASLDAQVIDARQALVTSAEQITALELQAIEVSRAKYADQVAHLQKVGKLQEDEAAELLKLNEERAALRAEAVKRREDERRFRMREAELQRQLEVQQGAIGAQAELLQSREGLARTTRERREIEQRLLDLQFAEEKMLLEAAIARETRLRAEYSRSQSQETLALLEKAEVEAALARQRLATLPERQANATAQNNQQNASPLQAYFDDIAAQGADLNAMFESVAAGGLRTFTDALTDAIVNFRSLGDVGRAVLQAVTADLVRLAIQQIILHTVGRSLGMASIATTTAAAAAAGAAWAGPAAMATLATLGANAGPAAAALASTTALATVLGAPKAGGGRIFGPGTDTSDGILTPTSRDEFVIKARSARRIGYDTLEHLNRTGEIPSRGALHRPMAGGGRITLDDYAAALIGGMQTVPRPSTDVARSVPLVGAPRAEGGRVTAVTEYVPASRAIRPMNVPAARPGGNGGNGFSQEGIAQLRSIVGDAISAMPALSFHPMISEERIADAVFNSPRGRRVAFDFFGNNRGAVKAQLNPP